MTVVVNGRPLELPDGASVADVVEASGAGGRSRGVAVAVDGEVVPRSEWEASRLASGASVEVVVAVQGG